jgi:hypothetical protein
MTFSKSMPYKFIRNDLSHTMVKEMLENKYTSSMYALKRRKEAKAIDPIVNPFEKSYEFHFLTTKSWKTCKGMQDSSRTNNSQKKGRQSYNCKRGRVWNRWMDSY